MGCNVLQVEDVVGELVDKLMVVLFPVGHLVRLCFGLSLMFYGMAFRTFAFHVIVFRVAGFKQVRRCCKEQDRRRLVVGM